MADLDTIVAYLLGEGELDGKWFGDPDVPLVAGKYKARYWWRSHLREAWNNRHGAGDAEDAARYRWLRKHAEVFMPGVKTATNTLYRGDYSATWDAAIDAVRAGERG